MELGSLQRRTVDLHAITTMAANFELIERSAVSSGFSLASHRCDRRSLRTMGGTILVFFFTTKCLDITSEGLVRRNSLKKSGLKRCCFCGRRLHWEA